MIESTNFLLSFALLVLNGTLLAGFIIPRVNRLVELKDSLVKFALTYVPQFGVSGFEISEAKAEQRPQRFELQRQLDVYRLYAQSLRQLVELLVLAGLLMILTILVAGRFPEWRTVPAAVNAIFQLGIFCYAVHVYAPSPERVSQVSYLVESLEINPHALVSALELEVGCQFEGWPLAPMTRADPLTIYLSTDLRLFGYRLALFIADEKEKRLHYFCGGLVKEGLHVRRILPPPARDRPPEYCTVGLGEFPFNLVEEAQELHLMLFMFLPLWHSGELHPLQSSAGIRVPGADSTEMMSGQAGGMFTLRLENVDRDIAFRGRNSRIWSIRAGSDSIFHRALQKFERRVRRARGIVQVSDVQGNLL